MDTYRRKFLIAANNHGFTLLEVMIAVAVIAIALVSLLGSQSQSIPIISEARFTTTAAMLAQEKFAELSLLSYDEIHSDSGEFDDEFASYTWATEVRTLTEEESGLSGADDMLKSVNLTISQEGGSRLALQTIIFKDVATGDSEE